MTTAFPTTPNDQDTVVRNGITWQYTLATNSWAKIVDPNKLAANIKDGVTIDGVEGTFPNDADAVVANVLSGKTFYSDTSSKLTGTMPNKVGSATEITPSTSDQTIAEGYYGGAAGDGKVLGDADLVAGNIKNGVTIFGVEGTYESSPTLDSWAEETANGIYLYYRKYGKLYVLNFRSTWSYWLKNDANTRSKVAEMLGITIDTAIGTYYQLGTSSGTKYYWGGSSWSTTTSYAEGLLAVVST